ncbi:adenosine receptor A3-like [Megalops cyprinoides]|uniref:adenosine receptor A3-like n=1 Tax=Megalops cyprinoides TaxID=118141 RepID=UPI001864B097|nr:adenosine receptor A3-like [Megalops cyprinoides]
MADEAGAVYVVVEVLIAVACCLGNALVIWAVWANSSLHQPTFCFIASLAIADFLVGAVAIPVAVLVDGRVQMSFHGCLFISCVEVLVVQSSVVFLLAIAVDRHLRVHIPLRYKGTITQKRTWVAVGACWLVSCVLGLTPMFGWYNHDTLASLGNSTTIVCQFIAVIPMSYLVYFNFFGCILLPLLVMVALYAHLFHTIRMRLMESRARNAESQAYYAKEKNLAKSLALVLLLFAACWLPLCLMNCMAFFGNPVNIPHAVFYVGIVLSHANSAVNPIVYAFKVPKISKAYLQIWSRCPPHLVPQNHLGPESNTCGDATSAVQNDNEVKTMKQAFSTVWINFRASHTWNSDPHLNPHSQTSMQS